MTAGLILAGGKSRRLGKDKSLLNIGGVTLIERAVNLLKPLFAEIYISSNEPEKFEFTGLPVISDIYPGKGPVAGIYSGLVSTGKNNLFVLAPDMPFINAGLVSYLVRIQPEKPVIAPSVNGYIQPLCGIYNKNIADQAGKILESGGSYSVRRLLDAAGYEEIPVDDLPFFHEKLFFNINAPEDLKKAENLFKEIRFDEPR